MPRRHASQRARYEPPARIAQRRAISITELRAHIDGFTTRCIARGDSRRTQEVRDSHFARLLWFLEFQSFEMCGEDELLAFFVHLSDGHLLPNGRWGEGAIKGGCRPMRNVSRNGYYRTYCTFFKYLVEQAVLDRSPMDGVPRPNPRTDQKEHLNREQIDALLAATAGSNYPERDRAMILLVLDTGMRAAEICGLRIGDIDLAHGRVAVLGKGDKRRTLALSPATAKTVRQYLRGLGDKLKNDSPLFWSEQGQYASEPLTTNGFYQIVARAGRRANIHGVRVSPHTLRHTFAFLFLEDGGTVPALQMMMGHEDPEMSLRYARFAGADVERQHRRHSPVERLGLA